VIHLQRYFNVSYPTALVRLLKAKFIDRDHFDQFKDLRPVLFAQGLGYEVGTTSSVRSRRNGDSEDTLVVS
jgi:hypothetical protein